VEPLVNTFFGYKNYDLEDIKYMHYLRLLPKELTSFWKDILSSSPLSSSMVSNSIDMNYVKLRADELMALFNTHEEEEMKESVVEFNDSLSKFDVVRAFNSFSKIDQIITERYNKELEGYAKKEIILSPIAKVGMRLGKCFTHASDEVAHILTDVILESKQLKWLPMSVLV